MIDRLRGWLADHGTTATAVFALVVFGGLLAVGDGTALLRALERVPPRTFLGVIGLTTVGYGFRFLKWHYYLRRLGVDVSRRLSSLSFFSGLMMVVTPGKAGELWKAWFLRDEAGASTSLTASAVGAERLTDVIALAVLAATGVVVLGRSSVFLVGVGGVLVGGILLVQWQSLCLGLLDRLAAFPVVGSVAEQLEEFYRGTYDLLRAWPLTVATVLSVAAWGLEGVALWLVLSTFSPEATLVTGLFVFGLGSVVGAVSLLPGGLGAAEASMVGLLLGFGYTEPVAVAATLVVRLGTLWYAAALGTTVFGAHRLVRGVGT